MLEVPLQRTLVVEGLAELVVKPRNAKSHRPCDKTLAMLKMRVRLGKMWTDSLSETEVSRHCSQTWAEAMGRQCPRFHTGDLD